MSDIIFPLASRCGTPSSTTSYRNCTNKYPVGLDTNTDDPQSCFDEYLVGYFDEAESGKSRSFYAHVEAFAEINPVVAGWRDEIYERILQGFTERIRPLCIGVDEEQIKLRALTVMLFV